MEKTCSKCFLTLPSTSFYPSRRICKECYFKQVYVWQKNNIEKKRAYTRKSMLLSYNKNPQPLLKRGQDWRALNKEWTQQYNKQYHRNNPEVTTAFRRLREHCVRQQTPQWANKAIIRKIYIQARNLSLETGILYTVDHIIPLQGIFVCGLHVETNLQIITKSENSRKKNYYADCNP